MIPLTNSSFNERLRESLQREAAGLPTLRVARNENIYTCCDAADDIYFIESGQVKLVMLSPDGKECVLAIQTNGDIFGESGLIGAGMHQEIATAMKDTTLKCIHCANFFLHLKRHSLLEGFVRYLSARVAEQQRLIGTLMLVDSEHRLAETLLTLARKLGKANPGCTRIPQKITHEELSQMVGTTRPRITEFLRKFRGLGLVERSSDHCLVVREAELAAYLDRRL